MSKLKLGIYWSGTCGGCDVAILDTHERILDIVAAADILFWPIAMDFKIKDVEAMPDGHLDVCLFNGAIRNSENEHIAKLMRKKSKVLVAFGACAAFGGIPGLSNLTTKKESLEMAYQHTVSTVNPEKTMPQTVTKVPEGELTLPDAYDTVMPLKDVVDVDYFIPGCPPPADLIMTAITAIVTNQLPPKGSTIAGKKNLCDECERTKEKKLLTDGFKRPYEIKTDPKKCLLEQGVICLGPATRSGCGAPCMKVNMPCRGCFGPSDEVEDVGAKMLSAIMSICDTKDEEEIARIVESVKDPAGTFYRFTLPISLLKRKNVKEAL